MTDTKIPLGRPTRYKNQYDASLLFAIERQDSRQHYLSGALPFDGVDLWNAWDLTWLNARGVPVAATAEIVVPATSPRIIESKSLKLYLNSLAMSRFADAATLSAILIDDLSRCAGNPVDVRISLPEDAIDEQRFGVTELPGACIDSVAIDANVFAANPEALVADAGQPVEETLHSHLLRSLCPVTAQPDIGSIRIQYKGPMIDQAGLLQYIISYREHNDFHEACVERIFVDILTRCAPSELSVYARYQRRGGTDINPYRSNTSQHPNNARLWRQ